MKSDAKFYLFSVAPSKQSFTSLLEKVESLLERDGLDHSKLGLSFTRILGEAVGDLRAESDPVDEKISKIEVELNEIASDVKRHIGQIFERGEKFGVLASKSEALRSSVRP